MNKILIIFFIIFFYWCTLPQENNSTDIVSNSGNIEKEEPEKQDIVEEPEEQEELSNLTKKEVYELVKDYDNSSKITERKNKITPYSTAYSIENREENEKIKDVNYIKNNPFLNQELKKFLKEIDLEFIYNLEELWGSEKLTQDACENIINRQFKEQVGNCKYYLVDNVDKRKKWEPFYIDVLLLNEENIYLNITDHLNLWWNTYWIFVYNISSWNIIKLNEYNDSFQNAYFFNNKLLFIYNFQKIRSKFDLENWDFYDYSERIVNKSNKWVLDIQDWNLIVESLLEDININLWKIEENYINENFLNSFNYFETNQDNTKYAFIKSISDNYDNITIEYWDFVDWDLDKPKTFSTKSNLIETMCFVGSNSAFYFIDDLIVTKSGCLINLELTVFDTNSEKFLYRSDNVEMDYFKDYE